MKKCNPLLRSWNKYLNDTAAFVVLRPFGHAFVESDRIVPNEPCPSMCVKKRLKKKGRR